MTRVTDEGNYHIIQVRIMLKAIYDTATVYARSRWSKLIAKISIMSTDHVNGVVDVIDLDAESLGEPGAITEDLTRYYSEVSRNRTVKERIILPVKNTSVKDKTGLCFIRKVAMG